MSVVIINDAFYISDMSLCTPASALSRDSRKTGCWTLVDYATEDGVEGVTMYATQENSPPPVRLSLDAEGWHKIFIGIHYTRTSGIVQKGIWGAGGKIKVKLSGDTAYREVVFEEYTRHAIGKYPTKTGFESAAWASIQEAYWKAADLTGQDIIFSQFAPDEMANVAYVKLVALNDAEMEEISKTAPNEDTRRLIMCIPTPMWGGDLHGVNVPRVPDEAEISEMIEPLRGTDFGAVILSAVRGEICVYPSKIGRPFGCARGYWNKEWLDPVAQVKSAAAEMDIDFYLSMRMTGATLPPIRFDHEDSNYYWENRQFALRDKEGNPASHLSLAFPEVRDYWLSYFRELIDLYDPDGVNVLFNRSHPYVLYEEPVIESFEQSYGEDPRNIPSDDERWLRHRAGFVTLFLREVRGLLDEEGEKRGKRYGTIYHLRLFQRHPQGPLWIAQDAEAWAKEGLADRILLNTVSLPSETIADTVRYYKKLVESTNTKIYPDLYPRTNPAEAYAEKAGVMYEAGADGFAFWGLRHTRISEWAMISMLGHRELLAGPESADWIEKAKSYYRRVPLKLLNGLVANPELSYTDG